MAGFNYTLAATLGVALLCVTLWFAAKRQWPLVQLIAVCACMLALASVISNALILSQNNMFAHQNASALIWAPGAFFSEYWGSMFAGHQTGWAIAVTALLTFFISYGVKLVGLPGLLRARTFPSENSRGMSEIILAAFLISLALGLLSATGSYGGVAKNIMYLQPAAWMIALFAAYPLTRWLGEGNTWIRPAILAVFLCTGAAQAFLSFNLGYKLTFSPRFMNAVELVRQESDPSDVIAFWPGALQTQTILSFAPETNNSFVAALTGLRGYFNSPGYSENFSVATISSVEPYEIRGKIISDLMADKMDEATAKRLAAQNVRWILLPKKINIPAVENVTTRISEPGLTLLQLRAGNTQP